MLSGTDIEKDVLSWPKRQIVGLILRPATRSKVLEIEGYSQIKKIDDRYPQN